MRIANEISARRIAGDAENAPPTSEILIGGRPTGCVVSGAILEAAVEAGDFRLLFMTDDLPYEDALSIHLVDTHWHLLDSALLGAAYSTGSFKGLQLAPPHQVRFRFIGDTAWTVEILPRPGYRLPYLGEPTGVSRKFGFSRHFVVSGNPQPQTR